MNLVNQLVYNYMNQPEKICLVQDDRVLSYGEFYKRVAKFKKLLEEKGIKPGDKILVFAQMSIELYICLFAIWSIGAIACTIDEEFLKRDIEKFDFNEIDALIESTKFAIYSNTNDKLSTLENRININIIELLQVDDEDELEINPVESEFPAINIYTLGRGGITKIYERSHRFLELQSEILQTQLKYDSRDVELSSIPFFALANIDIGITTVIADANYSDLMDSNPKNLISQINNGKINRIMASPGLLKLITDYCMKKNIKCERITRIFTRGGTIFLDAIYDLKNVFPNAKITILYGLVESEPISELDISDISMEDVENTKNGKGILAGNIVGVEDCKIIKNIDEELGEINEAVFQDLQTDDVGEIVVTGGNVIKGYLKGIGDSENKFSVDGKKYHRTGDLGYFDDKNRLWLKGRKDDPHFNIEAALHAKYRMGKIAVLTKDGKIIVVLERDNLISEKEIKQGISFEKIDEIKYVKKIPVDKRYGTKVDYVELNKMLK